MRPLNTSIALFLFAVICGCHAARDPEPADAATIAVRDSQAGEDVLGEIQDHGGDPWLGTTDIAGCGFDGGSFRNVTRRGSGEATEGMPSAVDKPISSFARMVGGVWKMTAQSGTSMYESWHWGPGMHSMRVTTEGEAADGSPWRVLQVVYWHPRSMQFCLLNMHPDVPGVGRGVGNGTIKIVGDTMEARSDLFQTRRPRKMLSRSIFTGPDTFRTTLLESSGSDGYQPLTAWDFFRTDESTSTIPAVPDGARRLPEELTILESLIGRAWEASGQGVDGQDFHIRSSYEFVPLAEYVYGSTVIEAEGGPQTHIFDVYFYYHVGVDALRCLALSNNGGVYEGDVTIPEAGAIQIALDGYQDQQAISRIVRFDFVQGGTMRQRVWSLQSGERSLICDFRHKRHDTGHE